MHGVTPCHTTTSKLWETMVRYGGHGFLLFPEDATKDLFWRLGSQWGHQPSVVESTIRKRLYLWTVYGGPKLSCRWGSRFQLALKPFCTSHMFTSQASTATDACRDAAALLQDGVCCPLAQEMGRWHEGGHPLRSFCRLVVEPKLSCCLNSLFDGKVCYQKP